MSMAQELDYTTLKWVRDEIDETLKQTRQALEAYVENPNDTTQIRFCTTYLHQVYGTLQMVEIYGGALLAEEMELLAHALLQGKITQKDESYDVLMRAILQLPSYLEHLEQGRQDLPIILLPLLNDLRSARGEPLLSENAFFSPNISVAKPPNAQESDKKPIDLKQYAKKLRSVFQSALVGLYRNTNVKGNLKKIGVVLRELQNNSNSDQVSRLWWVASGVIESLYEEGLEISSSVKQLIGQIDREIKKVIVDGEQAFDEKPANELLKNLLYYVANSKSKGKRVAQIKTAFNLDQLLPQGDDIKEAFESLRGSGSEIMQNVSSVIKEDLLHIKDQLDIFVRNKDHTGEQLSPLSEQLSKISDTLSMLGLGDLHKIIQDQINNITQIIKTGDTPSDVALMEIASALLYIESSLEGVESKDITPATQLTNDAASGNTLLPPNEQKQLTKLVISEAAEVLSRVKESFNSFANEPSDTNIIAETPEQLVQVKGVLAVLSLTHAATLLQSAIDYIAVELVKNKKEPNQSALDALADVITSVEYYLEAIAEARVHPESILVIAEKSVGKLVYTTAAADVETKSEPAFEITETLAETSDDAADPIISIDESKLELVNDEFSFEPDIGLNIEDVEELDGLSISLDDDPFATTSHVELKDITDTVDELAAQPAAAAPATPTPTTSKAIDVPEDDIDEEILEIFLEEAEEVIVVIRENLQAWKGNLKDEEPLITLRRSYHTIKGSGRLAGAAVIGEFAWSIEYLLNQVLENKIVPDSAMFSLLEEAENSLAKLLEKLKDDSLPTPHVQPIISAAEHMADPNRAPAEEIAPVSSTGLETPTQDIKLVEIFRKETATHLASIRDYIANRSNTKQNYVTEPLMRALHTLHGSARMANVSEIAKLSEVMDRYFRSLHDAQHELSESSFQVLRDGADMISEMVKDFDESSVHLPTPANYTKLFDQLSELHNEASKLTPVPVDPANITGIDSIDITDSGNLAHIFIEEANDTLAALKSALDHWKQSFSDAERMSNFKNTLLTFKDAAHFANQNEIELTCQQLDLVLDAAIAKQLTPPLPFTQLLNQGYAWLALAVENIRNEKSIVLDDGLLDRLRNELGNVPSWGNESTVTNPITDNFANDSITEITLEDDSLPNVSDASDFDFDDELVSIFLEEAQEIQEQNELTLQTWQSDIGNRDCIADMQRSLHTLKGGARMAKITAIGDFAHAIESVLENITAGNIKPKSELIQLIHQCHDWLSQSLDSIAAGRNVEPASSLLDELNSILDPHAPKQQRPSISSDAIANPIVEDLSESPSADIGETNVEKDVEPVYGQLEEIVLESPSEIPDETPTESALEALEAISLEEDTSVEIPEFDSSISIEGLPQSDSLDQSGYDEELISIFLEEADEIQENNDKILHLWSEDFKNTEVISILQRALHTLKGGARMAGVVPIGDMSHAIETLLEGVTERQLKPTVEFPALVHVCHDWLSNAIDLVKQNSAIPSPQKIVDELENLAAGKPLSVPLSALSSQNFAPQAKTPTSVEKSAASDLAAPEIAKKPVVQKATKVERSSDGLIELDTQDQATTGEAPLFKHAAARTPDEQIRVRAELIDNLVNFAGEANLYNARIVQQLNAWHFNMAELGQTVVRLQEQLRKFEIETEAQIMYRHTSEMGEGEQITEEEDAYDNFDPLEMDRFSYMQQLSRGMVESLGDLTSIQNLLENISSEADVLLLQQSRINTDLQEGLMRTRLTPFSSILARLRRIVRQTCQEIGKEANLNVIGAEGEMDRTQLNRIVPALEHILRNAIDHGIESPEIRAINKKDASANIEINFTREGSEVVITISDDGRGINVDALRKKAIERGLMTKGMELSDREIINFILESGFSTAQSVTQISGRGVGMDVVNTEIKQLNGSLYIDTNKGKGSTFTIRLPLTVLVNQALLVHVTDTTYAVQLSNIEHVVRMTGHELDKMNSGEAPVFNYAGQEYQHLNLGYVLHGVRHKPLDTISRFPMLLGRSGDQRVAIQVDHLVGRQEIVIKSLGPQLSSLHNISGATIMPDGEVALILDLSTLIRTNHTLIQQAAELGGPQHLIDDVEEEKPVKVMIVDDSITVRKVSQRLLTRNGFETMTAKDGVDALTVLLEEEIPDIMLLDIEMPRMDGYELATAMRNDERLKNIPIIMITSRTGDKHRDRAIKIGVNMYMGKPFQEHELLENINSLLNKQ